jgi:hypothetical protein
MFTIKYIDEDGLERLAMGTDVRADRDGKQVKSIGWLDHDSGSAGLIQFPTTVYVMNESGATVGKYVVIGND